MSLLLEALKQAALEKRQRREAQDADQAPPADDAPASEPVGSTSAPARPESTSEIMKGVNEFLLDRAEKLHDEPARETSAPEVDRHDDIEDTDDTVETDLLAVDDEPFEAQADDEPDDELIEDLVDADDAVELDESEFDWDAFEAAAEGELEDAGDIDEPVSHGPVPEPIRVEDLTWEQDEEPAPPPRAKADPGRVEQLLVMGREIGKRQRRRQNFLYFMLVLTAIGGVMAYYFFLLGSRAPRPSVAQVEAIADHEELSIPDRLIAPQPAPAERPIATTHEAAASSVAAPDTPVAVPAAQEEPAPVAAEPAAPRILNRGDEPPSRTEILNLLASTAATGEPTAVFTRTSTRPIPETQMIIEGYEAYQRGDFDAAATQYAAALERSPSNRDALLGAAATAVARSRWSEAFSHYQRVLIASPTDPDARIGMLALMQHRGALGEVGDELEDLLARYPDNAQLHFMRGMGFAADGRWSPAQQAFFEAYSRNRDSADYAFNLAVALDHLGQRREARNFYDEAVRLAERSGGRFDIATARNRMDQVGGAP